MITPRVPVDLTNCDSEPIHIPALIQPHGVLLAARSSTLQIVYASENAGELFHVPVAAILKTTLPKLLGEDNIASLEAALGPAHYAPKNIQTVRFPLSGKEQFDVVAHRSEGLLIVELEPASESRRWDLLSAHLESAMGELGHPSTIEELAMAIPPLIRRLTGYGRVMVYRFDQDGHGEIIAEEREPEMESFLGLHYPATDIPRQARALYLLQRLRVIVDVSYKPVRILANAKQVHDRPLDMSYCGLRSISPIHVEYLQNMGVGSALSISLIRQNELWGMIVCHHPKPLNPRPEVRALCDLLGQLMSLLLESTQKAQQEAERLEKTALLEVLGPALEGDDSISAALFEQYETCLSLVGADGALVYIDDTIHLIGKTPRKAEALALMTAMRAKQPNAICFTNEVGSFLPSFTSLAKHASGATLIPLRQNDCIVWFRKEVVQTVRWGGNPNESKLAVEGSLRLSPRKSFAIWVEVQKGRSLPWRSSELEAAAMLQNRIIRGQLRRATAKEANYRGQIEAIRRAHIAVEFQMNGSVIRSNDNFMRVMGYSAADLEGKHLSNFVEDAFTRSNEYKQLWDELHAGKFHTGRFMWRGKAGLEVWMEVSLNPILDLEGRPEKIVMFGSDVTREVEIEREHKQAEAALRRAATIEEANRVKSDFLANMSHEVRTPLNAIMGMTYLAMRAGLSPKQQSFLTKINNASHSLLSIMNDVLDFSKMEAGKLEVEDIPFSVAEILKNLLEVVGHTATEKRIDLAFVVAPEAAALLSGDPLRVGQILVNVVSNAIKFTNDGKVVIKVVAEPAAKNSIGLKFTVSDTGIGMTADQVSGLFQFFHQGDSSFTRRYGGTGLGLAISKQLCELMGGSIAAESEYGKGSLFTFHVMCGVTSEPGEPFPQARQGAQPPISILVVQAMDESRNALVEALKGRGFEVDAVAAGEDAIASIAQAAAGNKPFEAILMDWRLQDMDGIEVARQVKLDTSVVFKPAVILAVCSGCEEVLTQLDDVALSAFLIKPVDAPLLQRTLEQVFENHAENNGPQRNNQRGSDPLEGARVLLVEDQDINREIAAEMLREMGVIVMMASNGREAADLVTGEPYDAVLMDIQMPVLDGLAATRLIRSDKRFSNLPIIALTAHGMKGDRERSLRVGMNDHIVKPIDPESLAKKLRQWIPVRPRSEEVEATKMLDEKKAEVKMPVRSSFDLPKALARASGKPVLLRKLLGVFREQYSETVTDLGKHIHSGKMDDAIVLTHSLKGVARTLEAKTLAEAASALEDVLRSGHLQHLSAHMETLARELDMAFASARLLDAALATDSASQPFVEITSQPGPKPCILAVEDESSALTSLNDTFGGDYEILFATKGEGAPELAALKQPDLIILDITLPGVDGYEVCRRLKAEPRTRDIPVMFITGDLEASSEIKGLKLGAFDYITKPIHPATIRERVNNQIKLKRMQDKSRVLAAAEVAASYEHLNNVMDSTSEGILEITPEWVVLYGNRQASSGLRHFRIGDNLWTCFPALCTTPVQQDLRNAMEERRGAQHETYYAPEDRWYRLRAFPARDGMSIFFNDVTSEKNLHNQLSLERLLKEKRMEALSHMAAGLAHEISNPLAIIHGRASDLNTMAASGQPLQAKDIARASESIVYTSDRAINILRGLRGFANEARKDPMEPASVYQIIDQCLEQQQERFSRYDIELRRDLDKGIPNVRCRETQLGQIITNLLNNAVDVIVQSNAHPRWISVEATNDQKSIYIDVVDSGPGMSDFSRSHLMEPFFSTKELGLGMGIGLSLSRLIAEDHNGSLNLRDGVDHTSFRLTLPISELSQDEFEGAKVEHETE